MASDLSRAHALAKDIRLMAFDVDGVLTDGKLFFSAQGEVMKAFHSHDGAGLVLLQQAGIEIAIITGRDTEIVNQRAKNLGINVVLQGVRDKRTAYEELLQERKLSFSEAGFMGDDLLDLSTLIAVNFSAAPPEAHHLVRQHVTYLTKARAGKGAAREVCELILEAQGKLDGLWLNGAA